MIASQTRIVDLETVNSGDERFPPVPRQHARKAVAWACADRALIQESKAVLLSALR